MLSDLINFKSDLEILMRNYCDRYRIEIRDYDVTFEFKDIPSKGVIVSVSVALERLGYLRAINISRAYLFSASGDSIIKPEYFFAQFLCDVEAKFFGQECKRVVQALEELLD